jgi:hypothetical protein
MKKLYYLLAFIVFSTFVSCTPEDNDEPITADDLTGKWSCNEQSQFGNTTYEVEITKSGSSQIRISNFYQLGNSFLLALTISGQDLNIPQQTLSNIIFTGQGTILNRNRINLSFAADDGGGVIDNGSVSLSR